MEILLGLAFVCIFVLSGFSLYLYCKIDDEDYSRIASEDRYTQVLRNLAALQETTKGLTRDISFFKIGDSVEFNHYGKKRKGNISSFKFYDQSSTAKYSVFVDDYFEKRYIIVNETDLKKVSNKKAK